MRIAVNTRLLLAGKMDGIGWFTDETLRRIVVNHPEHDFYFFFDRKPSSQFIYAKNVHPVVLPPQARLPILWYLFFEVSVKHALKYYKIDLFLSPEGYMSLGSKVPTLTVFHDLNFEHNKNYLKPSHQRYMTYFCPQYARYSTRIATVSEYSKQDIVNTYHIEPEKIDVVYDGAHNGYHPLEESAKQNTRDKYTNGHKYFIFISTILKRKNLATLLTAFDHFKQSDKEGIKLVVVGQRVWWQDELKQAYDQMVHKEDTIFLGRVEAVELIPLLASAIALAYPSLFEGFGIPIIEAFQTDTPVITSNCTSMPEVAGEAAILVNPTDVNELSKALYDTANNNNLRQKLITSGRIQRQKFSWDITAKKLWDSMMLTIDEQHEY